jgi:hypothetical protein
MSNSPSDSESSPLNDAVAENEQHDTVEVALERFKANVAAENVRLHRYMFGVYCGFRRRSEDQMDKVFRNLHAQIKNVDNQVLDITAQFHDIIARTDHLDPNHRFVPRRDSSLRD